MRIEGIDDMSNDTPRNCTQVPFWFWNGPLNPDELAGQVREMADKGVHGAMPHPRFGMDRRYYLEPEYWKAFGAVVEQAESIGSEIILYDEYNWPSGGAGGRVTDGHPELYPRTLDYQTHDVKGPGRIVIDKLIATEPESETPEIVVAAFLVPADCPLCVETTEPLRSKRFTMRPWGRISPDGGSVRGNIPAGRHRVVVFYRAHSSNPSPLDGGSGSFVDYLNPKATQRYIRLTHEEYHRRFGRHFGKTISSIFTDEPQVMAGGPIPWTNDFADRFKKLRGYDIMPHLVALVDDRYPDGWKHRAAYWQTVAELMEKSFFAPIARWCRSHGIALTGHIYEEHIGAWPAAPHQMNWLRQFDWPGIDALCHRASPVAAKFAASVAHLEEKPHFVCEALGLANGWNCTLALAKGAYNFIALLGVDVLVPHAFHQTVESPRTECPPSFFFQNPYWKYYSAVAAMTDRLCQFNRFGHHVAAIAVYYPIESLWADGTGGKGQGVKTWQCGRNGNAWAKATIEACDAVITAFSAREHDCDGVDASLLARAKVLPGGKLRIGPETFSCIVLPAVRTIDSAALSCIDAFVRAGGMLLAVGQFPERVYPGGGEGIVASWFDGAAVPTKPGEWMVGQGRVVLRERVAALDNALPAEIPHNIRFLKGQVGAIYTAVRRTEDAIAWLVVNDRDDPVSVTVELPRHLLPAGTVDLQSMDPATGVHISQPFTKSRGGLRVKLQMEHTQAFILTARAATAGTAARPTVPTPPATRRGRKLTDWTIQLVPHGLDRDWTDSPKPEWVDLPVWKTVARGWRRLAGWTERGYDDGEWKQVAATRGQALLEDEVVLMRAHLPPGATSIKLPLPVSGEYILHVNGQQMEKRLGPPPKRGTMDLTKQVDGVDNVIAIEVSAMQTLSGLTEPPVVLCGEVALPRLMGWNELDLGWYSGRAVYRTDVSLPSVPREPVWLDLGRVEHYAEVWVNGSLVTTLTWPPYRAEISLFLRRGLNRIALVVSNSLASRFLWDDWGTRGGSNWGVDPRPEASGLIGPVTLSSEMRATR